MTIHILNYKTIEKIVSASGIIKSGKEFYVVSDDSSFLFALDKDFKTISKFPIHLTSHPAMVRIEKSTKPDFEALEMIEEDEIIIFGSGSKSPERDVFKRLSLKDLANIKSYQISKFYDSLRNLEILKDAYLNIEASAYRNGELFLFNRGKNIIFSFIYKDLISYFEGHTPLPSPKIKPYSLPRIHGKEAGFSGATTLKNHPYIVFTASVEDTDNAYDDGEILGSFIGMIRIGEDGPSNSFKSVIFPKIDKSLKIESVTIKNEIRRGETDIVVVTDDDLFESLIINCRLRW